MNNVQVDIFTSEQSQLIYDDLSYMQFKVDSLQILLDEKKTVLDAILDIDDKLRYERDTAIKILKEKSATHLAVTNDLNRTIADRNQELLISKKETKVAKRKGKVRTLSASTFMLLAGFALGKLIL